MSHGEFDLDQQTPSATCRRVEGLLPWLEGGTLDAGESEAVRRHLKSCPRCASALAAARVLARVARSHPPVEAIAAHVAGEGDAATRAAMERHAEECAACRDELDLAATAAHDLEQLRAERQPAGVPRRRVGAWLVAAGLSGALLSAWAIRDRGAIERQRLALVAEVERLSGRAAGLGSDLASADASRRELERRLLQSQAPRANDAVLELLPADLVLRGARERPAAIDLPNLPTPETRLLLILVLPPGSPRGPYAARWSDETGREIGRLGGLQSSAGGRLTLSLAGPDVPTSAFILELTEATGETARPIATYRLEGKSGSPLRTKPAQ